MTAQRYFQARIRQFAVFGAMLAVASFLLLAFIALNYERLVERTRVRGLNVLQQYQDVQSAVARIHIEVLGLMTAGLSPGDELRIYEQSGKIADALDNLAAGSPDGAALSDPQDQAISESLRQTIAAYRTNVLRSLEMMTVNPRLAEQYLQRSALGLSRLNVEVARHFDVRRSAIETSLVAAKERNRREVMSFGAVMLAIIIAVMMMVGALTRKLGRNFMRVEHALVGLRTDAPQGPADGVADGEFKPIVDSLARFRTVLVERDFDRSKMQAIFESILEGVVVIDDRGVVIQMNPIVIQLFGYPAEEILGRNISMLMPPEVAANHDRYLERYLRTGVTTGIVGSTRIVHGRRRDGTVFPIRLAVNAVLVGSARYFVGVIADITEEVENERLLRAARDSAVTAARLKAEFLATMSHEIRTPMNGVLGMAQLIAGDSIDEMDRARCAQILLNSSETLITLLNDILDLSKVEAGKFELAPEPTVPASIVEQTVALFADAAHAKGLSLEVSISPSVRALYLLDPTRVRQMLSNLVGNAVKFTEAGRISVEASVEAERESSGTLVFRVVDSGPGITVEEQAKLFEKFAQLDTRSTRRHGGSGLGLSIVRQFATVMHGDVGVDSEPGQGSTFWFSIPARKAVGAVAAEGNSTRAATGPAAVGAPSRFLDGRVLIAEDIPANRMILQLALRSLGVVTETAANGREAVDAVMEAGPFDCILMDVKMPEMDGEEATRLIRQWEIGASRAPCPIIAVTANAFEEDRRQCREAGMNDFIAKPVKLPELKRMLERWLPAAAVG